MENHFVKGNTRSMIHDGNSSSLAPKPQQLVEGFGDWWERLIDTPFL